MEENGKYLRLLGRIGLLFIVFIVSLFILIYGLKYFFGLVDSMSWFSLFFALFVICVPALIFITVYIIYYNHTKGHHNKAVRIFSTAVFAIILCFWVYFLVLDIILFATKQYRDIQHYNTYNLAFLSANVGIIFFIGILQALTTKKEVHWMDRDKE
jgi:hypothetical protein